MSAKWRRNKKGSRWFDIFGTTNKIKGKKMPLAFQVKNLKIKKRTRPYTYTVPKILREKRWKEPRPLIDVLEEKDEIIVIAEFAGFNRENLRIGVKNQRLTLSAEASERKYYKSLNLPERVIPDIIRTKYKNGVLEIRLKKDVEEKTIDKLAG